MITLYETEKSCITTLNQTRTFGMFLKLYKNSFSDKMHWSPGFHKEDLVGLEMAKEKKQECLITELEIMKQEI